MPVAPVNKPWSVESGEQQLQRESLADKIRAELARPDHKPVPLTNQQAEAATRLLLPVLQTRREVIQAPPRQYAM